MPWLVPGALVCVLVIAVAGCAHEPPALSARRAAPPAVAAPTGSVAPSASPVPPAPPPAPAPPAEDPAEASDLPDEPAEGEGQVRTVGSPKSDGTPCRLRIAPEPSSLSPVVLGWIRSREEIAARYTSSLCRSGRPSGAVAAGFACSVHERRPALTIAACYVFPDVAGNANPEPAHAVFDTAEGRVRKLGVADMFVSRAAVCTIAGRALAARDPQLQKLSPRAWEAKCVAARGALVADDAVSVRGRTVTFDTSYEFWAFGNARDALEVPIADLAPALTPRFAALLNSGR